MYLRKHNIVHRDIKGANIIITVDRKVKVSQGGKGVRSHTFDWLTLTLRWWADGYMHAWYKHAWRLSHDWYLCLSVH